MKPSLLIVALLAALLFPALRAVAERVPPQAAPMVMMLQAIKSQDADAFRKSFSSRRIQEAEKSSERDWKTLLGEGREHLARDFGEYTLSDFTYSYLGAPNPARFRSASKGRRRSASTSLSRAVNGSWTSTKEPAREHSTDWRRLLVRVWWN